MKISCQSCQAKYTIADEKVVGKIVKIRCKKCGATIVINGNEQTATTGAGGGDGNVYDYTAQSGSEQWTVNVNDGDQRSMTAQEIVQEYRAGTINDETYCWKDGMADWLPLREIEQLYRVCTIGPRPSLEAYAPSDRPPAGAGASGGAGLFGGGDATEQVPAAANGGNGAGAGLFGSSPPPAAAPVAARRAGRGGGGDLFGAAAAAGGEEDVMTSAPTGTPEAIGDQKLTGQRNENSVLFSLSALSNDTAKKPDGAAAPQADGSGLIDIRALSASMDSGKKEKNNHVDDIMNLGGGGAFGAALAAPILAPPPLEAPDLGGSVGPVGGKNKNMVIFGALGAVMVAMLGTIIFLVTRTPEAPPVQAMPMPTTSAPAPTDTGAASAAPTSTGAGGAVAMNDSTPKPPGGGDTARSPTEKADRPHGGGGGHAGGGGGGAAAAGGGGGGAAAAPALPTPPPAPKGPTSLGDAMRDSAGGGGGGAPAAAAPVSEKPFDRGAAAAALGAVNVASCKKPDGPTGSGHVSVTFQGDGSVSSAVVDQPPFAGTPVGGCVAGKFRGARVPAFSGGNIKVGKSFIIN